MQGNSRLVDGIASMFYKSTEPQESMDHATIAAQARIITINPAVKNLFIIPSSQNLDTTHYTENLKNKGIVIFLG